MVRSDRSSTTKSVAGMLSDLPDLSWEDFERASDLATSAATTIDLWYVTHVVIATATVLRVLKVTGRSPRCQRAPHSRGRSPQGPGTTLRTGGVP